MLGQPPKDSGRNIFIGGLASQKIIDTTISIPQSTVWYSDVIDLDKYGALGVIAKSSKVSAPSYGYLYVQFSDDPNFSEIVSTNPFGNVQEVAMVPRVGRYMRLMWQSYSITGTYQYRISAVITPFPVYPFSGSTSPLSYIPVAIRSDTVALAKSSDIPVPYRFAQTYSAAAGANTGTISIDLNSYRDCAVYILADQNTSITIQGSIDNTNWEAYDSGSGTANTPWTKAYTLFPHRYLGITVTNSGSSTATIKVRVVASKF
jgi:hypothetical protein